MILCHEALKQAIIDGEIHVNPLCEDMIDINSINIRLGPDLWALDDHSVGIRDVYTPDHQSFIWKKQIAVTAKDFREKFKSPDWAKGVIPDNAQVFVLYPGVFYLATTLEEIGSAKSSEGGLSIIPTMKARSTFGRHGMTVARCAGMGDVAYKSRWALEVTVDGTSPVALVIGTPIGQVVFHYGTATESAYGGHEHYQTPEGTRFLPKGLGWDESQAHPLSCNKDACTCGLEAVDSQT